MKTLIVLVALVSLFVFSLGFFLGSRYFTVEMGDRKLFLVELQEQQEQLDQQTAELIRLRVISEVDQQALERLQRSSAVFDERLSTQREELMLYRKLLKIDSVEDGLHVFNLTITPTESPSLFAYSFVIRQSGEALKTVSVDYDMLIEGQLGSDSVSYSLADLDMAIDAVPVKTKLKYFRLIEGQLQLPEGFAAQKLELRVRPVKKPAGRRVWTFDWLQIKGQPGALAE